jgi:AbrB family transcriptional regulator, stage V sporulation protein T
MTYQAKIITGGKISIPADLRRDLGFVDGDTLFVERNGNSVVLKSKSEKLREIQKKFRGIVGDYSVDQFLAERAVDSDD